MDLLLPIFQLAYFVVHFLYSLGQAVLDCFHELYFILLYLFRKKKHFVPDSNRLLEDVTKVKKIPRHMGYIFLSKHTNGFKNICYLINWSKGFGIHNVSIYDIEGLLKLKLPTLLNNIAHLCLGLTVRVIVDGQVYITECNVKTTDANNVRCHKFTENEKHSHYRENSVNLNVYCIEDGKEDIVKIIKQACEKRSQPFNSSFISDNLISNHIIDPDLLVVVGRPICMFGFLPWQARLTEFLNIPSVSRLDYFEFRKLLQIYSKCEQRFGS